MDNDLRGWRIALVPDALINPPRKLKAKLPDALAVLEATGYGLLQLPASRGHRLLVAVTADQVAEYAHHGYAIVAIGVRGLSGDGLQWHQLAPELRRRGVTLPPRHVIRPAVDPAPAGHRLAAFLEGYDLPVADRHRWRQ